eukprot:6173364-Pleurochrysis_carterae.AAC.5
MHAQLRLTPLSSDLRLRSATTCALRFPNLSASRRCPTLEASHPGSCVAAWALLQASPATGDPHARGAGAYALSYSSEAD